MKLLSERFFLILVLSSQIFSSSFADEKSDTQKNDLKNKKIKNYFTYEYEKKVDESLKEYSKIKLSKRTPLERKFIEDLIKKNFDEQRAIRAEQRALYLELWKKGEAIMQKEWKEFEKDVAKLEAEITADDIQKNVEVFTRINMLRGESNYRIKKQLFDKLHEINEQGGQLQLQRNIEIKEKIRDVLTKNQ